MKSTRRTERGQPARRVVFTSLTLFTSLLLCALIEAQSQRPPVFRTRVDLMQLDVTVLDKNGQPVRGLTKEDFTLIEDKTPQVIEAFTAVDLPDRVTGGPTWESKVVRDVTTNEIDNQRIFVILLDDALGMPLWAKRELKASATKLVEALGPKDLAAVVFTGNNYRANQNLTTDRARLIKAVQSYPDNDGGVPQVLTRPNAWATGARGGARPTEGPCLAYTEILRLFEATVNHLSTLPDRRKAILYFGSGLPWAMEPQSDACGTYWKWRDIFAVAQQAHVTINPVNTGGFTGQTPEHYLAVAENTGGHAVINNNDLMPGIRQILVQNSSYYLLAYQPTNVAEDGTFRRLTVKVNRPDVEVITRRNYWAPRTKTNEPPPPPPPPEVEALAGVLPLSDLGLRVTAAPFAMAGSTQTVIALALGVKQPALASRTQESVEVLIKAFTATGDPMGTVTNLIPITVPAAGAGRTESRYDVLTRIEVAKPGKYELRLSASSTVSGTRGSVYVDVDVPDFKKEKLSLSGVVLTNALSTTPVAPARGLRDIVPVVPTTDRAFVTTDALTAFLRVYQGGKDKLAPATLKIQIQDAAGKAVFDKTETLAADQFDAERQADYPLRVPLQTLGVGEYLLTFEAAIGKTTARRDVRFSVR